MFLKCAGGYGRAGQWARGPYLMLFDSGTAGNPNASRELRACVRHVRMHQCGHFMMGAAQIGPFRIPLSGPYGSDGLPRDADAFPGLWNALADNALPNELVTAFWQGGGHNGTGSEAPSLRAWALANAPRLRRYRRDVPFDDLAWARRVSDVARDWRRLPDYYRTDHPYDRATYIGRFFGVLRAFAGLEG